MCSVVSKIIKITHSKDAEYYKYEYNSGCKRNKDYLHNKKYIFIYNKRFYIIEKGNILNIQI